jgi:hypothetical protein
MKKMVALVVTIMMLITLAAPAFAAGQGTHVLGANTKRRAASGTVRRDISRGVTSSSTPLVSLLSGACEDP